ncbi:MAG: hypothetical protein IJU81_01735 [Bacteroidales bacterium]|nr:hypothetical protein [Bacteroidales bacterium]
MPRRRTHILLYIAFAAIIGALVVAANILRGNSTLRGISIAVNYPAQDTLLVPSDIDTLLLTAIPGLRSQPVKHIDTRAINALVAANPYVLHCHTSISAGRTLRLRVTQRQPVMYLILPDKSHLYYDNTATPIPPNPKVTPAVATVLASSSDTSHIAQACTLACFLADNSRYSHLATHISIQPDGTLTATSPNAPYTIIIGDASSLPQKFNLLATLLSQLPQSQLNRYQTINLRYNNQIVCKP